MTAVVTGGRRRGRGWLVFLLLLALVGGSAAGGYLLWDRVLAPITPIPVVQGADRTTAVQDLRQAGFEVRVADDRRNDLATPAGSVLEQEPTGTARQGQTVTVILSAGPRQVEVADVVGDLEEDATQRMADDGLDPAVEQVYDEEVPAGAVVAVDPAPGVVVDEASTVTLTVSQGPAPIEVPGLTGGSQDDASRTLGDLGLDLEVVERRHDPEAPAGEVLSQTPGPGATLTRDEVVEVVVSDGPAPVEVPNLRGEGVDDAVAAIEEAGLEVEVERRGGFRALLTPNRVYDQDPAPGTTVAANDTILLYAYDE